MKCVKGYEIKPMKSAAGWYMGTTTEEGFPNCRITSRYYKTAELAEENMDMDYRHCAENEFCSNGRTCYKKTTKNKKKNYVSFGVSWQAYGRQEIELPDDIDPDDEDEVIEYIESVWDDIPLPSCEDNYVDGSDELDYDSIVVY